MRGMCDLAHRAWRGRGLRHWGSLPLHGQVSITRGYSVVSLCLVLFDCAHASDASFKRPERWCSAGDGSDTCPSVNACNSERRACAALGQHRGETQVEDAHLVTVPPFYLDILLDIANSSVPQNEGCFILKIRATELSPHPHQPRSNVNGSARFSRYLDRTICLIPPIPRCERT